MRLTVSSALVCGVFIGASGAIALQIGYASLGGTLGTNAIAAGAPAIDTSIAALPAEPTAAKGAAAVRPGPVVDGRGTAEFRADDGGRSTELTAPHADGPAVPPADGEGIEVQDRLDAAFGYGALDDEDIAALTRSLPSAQTGGTPQRRVEEFTVSSGDTFMELLAGLGIDRQTAHGAIAALSDVFDPRRLQIGQKISVTVDDRGQNGPALLAIETLPAVDRIARARLTDEGGFVGETEDRALTVSEAGAAGAIESSLYVAATRAGVPDSVLYDLIRTYSHSVDFQRDIQRGDGFEVLYEREHLADGTVARTRDVLYANLILQGYEVAIYRFEDDDGFVDYYDRGGESIRRVLMRTPIDGARLSSGFGMRRHPILGYNRMHRGVDFAAPRGTPIYASGDGIVEVVGRKGGYGNYIRLRHASELKTAYAHLHRFAKGMTMGTRVRQGQVIGFVGSTGQSTGPHLHYEVIHRGKQVNPHSVDVPSGKVLTGAEMARFERAMSALDRRFAGLVGRQQFAEAD